MTRVPKFRAWDKRHKEMFNVEDMVWSYQNNGEHYFLGVGDSITFWRDADEIELMQSTGLKDNNGVEIYESDVVNFEDADDIENVFVNQGVIEWCQGGFTVTNRTTVEMSDLLDGDILEVTIIGNIYENKELLE